MHRLHVALHLLAGAVADHGLAVLVDLHHQLLGLLLRVAEVLLEHVGDVGHQVDRVVPHDRHPRLGGEGDLVGSEGRLDLDGGRHDLHVGTLVPVATAPRPGTSLLTDHYEFTMLQAALRSGTAHRRSVFELFPRRLPEGRRYGVVAGVGRALDAIERFRFDEPALALLADVVDGPTLEWLASYRFSGDVWGYAEGEAYFPFSPILIVESTFAEAVLLETLLLSIYNHDSAIASAASRMTLAAGDRPCIEMGSRRTHEEAAVAAARAAYVAGFATQLEPRRPGAVRRADGRHQRAQLHAAARHRGGRVPRAGGVARHRHDAARRHLRRRGGRAAGGLGGRHRARRRPPRLRRPGGARACRCARSSTRSARPGRGSS